MMCQATRRENSRADSHTAACPPPAGGRRQAAAGRWQSLPCLAVPYMGTLFFCASPAFTDARPLTLCLSPWPAVLRRYEAAASQPPAAAGDVVLQISNEAAAVPAGCHRTYEIADADVYVANTARLLAGVPITNVAALPHLTLRAKVRVRSGCDTVSRGDALGPA